MRFLKNFFLGEVYFCIKDADCKLLNKLRIYNLKNVKICNNEISFCVPLINKLGVIRVVGKREYTAVQNNNIFALLDFFYARAVLIFAGLFCFAALAVFSNLLFSIRITGVEGEEREQVMSFLRESGIKRFSYKMSQNVENATRGLQERFDFVAHASGNIVGSSYIFYIYRAENVGEKVVGVDIIARADCVVTEVIVYSGTALVAPGDVVRAGDILISGTYKLDDETTKPCRAVGIVMGDIKYSKSAITFVTSQKEALGDVLVATICAETGIDVTAFDKIDRYYLPINAQGVSVEVVCTINKTVV